MCEILAIRLFGHFEKWGFKALLRSPRTQISPVNGGMEGGEGC